MCTNFRLAAQILALLRRRKGSSEHRQMSSGERDQLLQTAANLAEISTHSSVPARREDAPTIRAEGCARQLLRVAPQIGIAEEPGGREEQAGRGRPDPGGDGPRRYDPAAVRTERRGVHRVEMASEKAERPPGGNVPRS